MNVSAVGLGEQFYQGVSDSVQRNSETGNNFDSVFKSALNMVNETNQLSNAAEEQEVLYAMGKSDSLHDLMVAQQKANVSLQYTVAVKNTAVEAYKSILNLQF